MNSTVTQKNTTLKELSFAGHALGFCPQTWNWNYGSPAAQYREALLLCERTQLKIFPQTLTVVTLCVVPISLLEGKLSP